MYSNILNADPCLAATLSWVKILLNGVSLLMDRRLWITFEPARSMQI